MNDAIVQISIRISPTVDHIDKVEIVVEKPTSKSDSKAKKPSIKSDYDYPL